MQFGRKRKESPVDSPPSVEDVGDVVETVGPGGASRDTDDPEVLRENWLRAAAELDNQRKRAAGRLRQRVAAERRVMLEAFLEVFDSLDHALAAHEGEDNDWVQGTRAIRVKTLEVLRRFGAKPFRSKGEMFDPVRHEAVGRDNDPDQVEGAILKVMQSGFELHDGSLLRPAKVVVNQPVDGS